MTPRPGSDNPDADPNGGSSGATERIIERFGGIRPMAHKLDMPVTTVQGWKKRGAIPLSRHADLRAAAVKHRVALDEADLDAATPVEDRPAADTPATVVPATVVDAAAEPPAADTVLTAAAEPPAPDDKAAGDKAPEDTIAGDTVAGESAAAPAGEPVAEVVAEQPATEPAAEPEPTPEPAPAYTPAPYATEQRSGGGFATMVSLLALIVGAAALSEPWWAPSVPGWPGTAPAARTAPANGDTQALRAQVQQLTDRIAKLEQRPASSGASTPAADVQALADRVATLEKRPTGGDTQTVQDLAGRVAALEKQGQAPDLTQRLSKLEQTVGGNSAAVQEVAALKQQVADLVKQADARRDAAGTAQALVLAAGQLRGALAGDQPFQSELQAVRALGVSDPQVTQALDAIAPYAPKGIPTRAQLAERFEPLANEIVKAAHKGEGGGWTDQVLGSLSTLVTVRRQGGAVVGDTPEAITARAEAAEKQGNLPDAVAELSKLQGPAARAASGWLADAKARLDADAATKQLTGRAIAALTAVSGGKTESAQ